MTTELEKMRALLDDEGEYIHQNLIEKTLERERAIFWVPDPPDPEPPTCVYCNAPWSPEMLEMVEVSGYCPSCSDSERVIDIFCSACERLVYRKEV